MIDNTEFPNHMPTFGFIVVDPEDNILVFPKNSGEIRYPNYFDVFNPEGKFIKKVNILSGKIDPRILIFGRNFTLWSLIENDDEEMVIAKVRISPA